MHKVNDIKLNVYILVLLKKKDNTLIKKKNYEVFKITTLCNKLNLYTQSCALKIDVEYYIDQF